MNISRLPGLREIAIAMALTTSAGCALRTHQVRQEVGVEVRTTLMPQVMPQVTPFKEPPVPVKKDLQTPTKSPSEKSQEKTTVPAEPCIKTPGQKRTPVPKGCIPKCVDNERILECTS